MSPETHHPSGSAYEIRVKGHLVTHWAAYFEGWSIHNVENGEALLMNPDVDQAGLHGTLNRIRDLNLTLLSVRQINPEGGA